MITIYFDMDGTIADLYTVENWLEKLRSSDVTPYLEARPLLKFSSFARLLNKLQRNGYRLGIISWTSRGGSMEYNEKVAEAKKYWLHNHLASVHFDEIKIVNYGTPKEKVADDPNGILFDDEQRNRTNWTGRAFDANEIISILKGL